MKALGASVKAIAVSVAYLALFLAGLLVTVGVAFYLGLLWGAVVSAFRHGWKLSSSLW